MEALRCLKRYIAREVFTLLRNQNRQINSTQINDLTLRRASKAGSTGTAGISISLKRVV
jgi:hypothetical protein